jgi:restriction system protein
MAIPDYQTLMLPLLRAVSNGKVHKISKLYDVLSNEFNLTEEERNKRLPSGRETYIKNRISWARTYLKKAGLINSPSKGLVQISAAGKELLQKKPKSIDNRFLRKYKGFVEFRPRERDKKLSKAESSTSVKDTPSEEFESSYNSLRDELTYELLETIKQSDPFFFEKLVIDLMLAMGYGGSRRDAGEATRKTKDGGIDGVIREDLLGLDTIYLQAKRYSETIIGEPAIRDFAGALQGVKAKKGVFITTSTFSSDAKDFVNKIDSKIILIDGKRLSGLMVDHNVGVSTKDVYEIKQIDTDYFSDI